MQHQQTASQKNSIVFTSKDGARVRFSYVGKKITTDANELANQTAILTLKTHLKNLLNNFTDKKRSMPERVNKIAQKIQTMQFNTLRGAVSQFSKIQSV